MVGRATADVLVGQAQHSSCAFPWPYESGLAGQPVRVRITLDGAVAVYEGEQCVAQHVLQPPAHGWATVPAHHAALWADTLAVEQRPLAVYEEVATWS